MGDAGMGKENPTEEKFSISIPIIAMYNIVETVLVQNRRRQSDGKISAPAKKAESSTELPSCVRDI
eukprot:1493784-Ditylum_brightwellii.AAC.1